MKNAIFALVAIVAIVIAAPALADRQCRSKAFHVLFHIVFKCSLVEPMLVKDWRSLRGQRRSRRHHHVGFGCCHTVSP